MAQSSSAPAAYELRSVAAPRDPRWREIRDLGPLTTMPRHVPKCACKRVKGDRPPGWVCVWGVVESAPLQNPDYSDGEFVLRAYYGETEPGVYGYRIGGIEGWWTGLFNEDEPTVVPGAPSREKLRKTATEKLSWAVAEHVEGGWEEYEE